MAKVIDITDKLSFDEKPKLVIKECELTVDNSAETALRIMGMAAGETEAEDIEKMVSLLFGDDARKLNGLKLTLKDYRKVIQEAMKLLNEDESEGEA